MVPYKKIWSGRRDSDPRHLPWQGNALPLSHSRAFTYILVAYRATCTATPTPSRGTTPAHCSLTISYFMRECNHFSILFQKMIAENFGIALCNTPASPRGSRTHRHKAPIRRATPHRAATPWCAQTRRNDLRPLSARPPEPCGDSTQHIARLQHPPPTTNKKSSLEKRRFLSRNH